MGLPTNTRTVLLVAACSDAEVLSEILAAATLVAGANITTDDVTPG